MTEKQEKTNRLINEKSPYLLQHAHNPVDWYPWGEEAFAKAREGKKPIFLSVGYSTCHWCHVMERESFENDSIAALLNQFFVPIKVDREERPDVDRVYMTALQAMGQDGGWPMSMFLTPDLKPFYGGTYFPPESRQGRAGFPDVLQRIHEVWEQEWEKVEQSATDLSNFLNEASVAAQGDTLPGPVVLDHCYEQFRKTFDDVNGGFGRAPKFPRPAALQFLVRYFHRTGKTDAMEMVARTLGAMAAGGIHDHIGGGFHRYAVDSEWRVPHFEKMLYDQAQLVTLCVEAYQATREQWYADLARSIVTYILRDMTSPDGGFYSAEDADSPKPENPSEEGEGAFYLWTRKEILQALGEGRDNPQLTIYNPQLSTDVTRDDARLFVLAYGVEEEGNALVDPQQEFTGKNILYVAESTVDLARLLKKEEKEIEAVLDRSRHRLLEVRSKRPRPLRDDKIIVSWNGLMIAALARAGAALEDAGMLQAASRAASFILQAMCDPERGTLLRRYRDGEAKFDAHLSDYAFFIDGLLELHQATQEIGWLNEAVALAGEMIGLFHDAAGGGFFETSGKDPTVLVRLKEQYDGAEPTGNSAAAMDLLRLSVLTGKAEWRTVAERTTALFGDLLARQPVILPSMATVLHALLSPPPEIVIVGQGDEVERQMAREVHKRYLPGASFAVVDPSAEKRPDVLNPFIRTLTALEEKTTAYVCENFACKLPTNDVSVMTALLDRLSPS